MTRQRNDSHSTEFGIWLRNQPEIDSKLGFVTTNLDWENYKTGKWILIEEKRFMSNLTFSQKNQLKKLVSKIKDCNFYGEPHLYYVHRKEYRLCRGFYLIQFENTSPEDGKIYLNHKEITKDKLIEFLKSMR